jgi:hypothetical protein
MPRLKSTIVCCLFWVFAAPLVAHSTTIVVKLEDRRIILVADTRAYTDSLTTTKQDFHNSICKIVALGNVGFAATGFPDYHKSQNDSMSNWSAWEDAKTYSALHKDNLVEMADDWGRAARKHYQILYSMDPSRVRRLATVSGGNILVQGLFAGWDTKRLPSLVSERITLDESASPSIVASRNIYAQRDLPYTTNDHTKKLIEGDLAKKWKKTSKHFPKSERDWRWIEFLIQSTSEHDQTVGKDADVLEILPSGSDWLHKTSCPAY